MNTQQMAAQLQQLTMQNRVLMNEKGQLLHTLERMRAQFEKDKAIENFIACALTGYASQPRAADEVFWGKDPGTGVMSPLKGGPQWAANMAFAAMAEIIGQLERMAEQHGGTEGAGSGGSEAPSGDQQPSSGEEQGPVHRGDQEKDERGLPVDPGLSGQDGQASVTLLDDGAQSHA